MKKIKDINLMSDIKTSYPIVQTEQNKKLIIEGKLLIDEYTDEYISVKSGELLIKIYGDSIDLKYLSPENITIDGIITRVEYIKL